MGKGKMTKKGYIGFGFFVFVFSMVASIMFGMIFILPIMLAQLALVFGHLTLAIIFLAVIIIAGVPIFFLILGFVFVRIGKYKRTS